VEPEAPLLIVLVALLSDRSGNSSSPHPSPAAMVKMAPAGREAGTTAAPSGRGARIPHLRSNSRSLSCGRRRTWSNSTTEMQRRAPASPRELRRLSAPRRPW
jgi:hypothetical protein